MVKGLEPGDELLGERGGVNHCYCVRTKRDNILPQLCVFAPLGHNSWRRYIGDWSNLHNCTLL